MGHLNAVSQQRRRYLLSPLRGGCRLTPAQQLRLKRTAPGSAYAIKSQGLPCLGVLGGPAGARANRQSCSTRLHLGRAACLYQYWLNDWRGGVSSRLPATLAPIKWLRKTSEITDQGQFPLAQSLFTKFHTGAKGCGGRAEMLQSTTDQSAHRLPIRPAERAAFDHRF